MVITLIGYRGTGKSTVAAPLAERLGFDWIDADPAIEQAAGCTIRVIFDREGEAGFRVRERAVLQPFFEQDRLIVAAGGGAILNENTRRDMVAAGPVVWLTASIDTILSRIGGDETSAQRRPSLTDAGGRAEVEHVLEVREPLYRECATLIVTTEGRSIAHIVDEIIAGLCLSDQTGLQEGAAG